jgi:hypothetical protein
MIAMNNAVYKGWYTLDGDNITYLKIVAVSRVQAKKLLDKFVDRYVGADAERSPLPDYLCHTRIWEWATIHGGDEPVPDPRHEDD